MPSHHGKSGTSAGVAQGKGVGRTDAGPNRTTAYKAGVGSIDESGKLVGKSHQQIHGGGGKTGTAHVIGKPEDYENPPFKNPVPNVGPLTWGINFAAKQSYKSKEKYARKHGLYRDYYRGNQYNPDPTKRTLKTNTPEGRAYLKDAGYGKTSPTQSKSDPNVKCPDGSNPPCPATTSAGAAKPTIAPYKPYYMGFDFQEPMDPSTHKALPGSGVVYPYKKGGLSGGKRYGPPPKKGPNPHGKCPSRPDGIRGVGAVQPGRGVKFVGVK